jgi:hypothetical protein
MVHLIDVKKLNSLQKLFLENIEFLIKESDNKIQIEFNDELQQFVVTIRNPKSSEYDISIYIDVEIIIFFNSFHMHHDNFGFEKEKSLNKVAKEALDDLKLLLTSKMRVTSYYRNNKKFRATLDILNSSGNWERIYNWAYAWKLLLFFIPTTKITEEVSFDEMV